MIKGLRPQLAEAGKIKIGGLGEKRVAKSGREYMVPQKWDHFQVTTTARDRDGRLEVDRAVMAALPKDPDGKVREIPIVLHSDDIETVFPTTYALYTSKKLVCRGDGETATRWPMDTQHKRIEGEPKKCQCPCGYLNAERGPKCKPNGMLRCSLALPGQAVAGAVHTWRTTSIISIQRMVGSLAQVLETCGTLRGLPLVLRVEPVVVNPTGGATSTVYCCHVELRAADVMAAQRQALQVAQMRKAIGGDAAAAVKLLAAPAGDDETPEEQAEIEAEFYSDPDPADDGRHAIPDEPPAEPPKRNGTMEHIQSIPDATVSEQVEGWLRRVVNADTRGDVIAAAAAKLELLVANRAKRAMELEPDPEPPHDPQTGEVLDAPPDPMDMPAWDEPEREPGQEG